MLSAPLKKLLIRIPKTTKKFCLRDMLLLGLQFWLKQQQTTTIEPLLTSEVINKANGNLGTSGSVEFMFDRTCNFRINPENIDPEEIELEFIDVGVEEVFADEDGVLLYGPFENFGAIQKELENRSFEILSSGFERIPQTLTKLSAEQIEEVEKLIEKIEEDDDVMNVYHNLDLTDQT